MSQDKTQIQEQLTHQIAKAVEEVTGATDRRAQQDH